MEGLYSPIKNSRAIYNFVKNAGNELVPAIFLAASNYMEEFGEEETFIKYLYKTYQFYNDQYLPLINCPALLNGDDLTKIFNLKPSPFFKVILDKIDEERALKVISTKEEAMALAKNLIIECEQGK